MSAQAVTRMIAEEYLAADRAAEFRSEYYDGRVYAIAVSSFSHSFVMSRDARLRVSPGRVFKYPDIMVVCGEPRFADDQKDTLLNPTLIAEVLSP